jgi:two-component system sensor histidine kinase AlgZ
MPIELLWQPSVIISVILIGEMLAAVLALAPGIQEGRWVYFGLTSMLVQWISLLTLTTLYLARKRLSRWSPNAIANLALIILLAITSIVLTIVWAILQDLFALPSGSWKALWLQFSGIALSVGLLGLLIFQNYWKARRFALLAKQAELDVLHARIHPHFLFNTLNTGAALIHLRPEAAERVLLDLADLFRAALSGSSEVSLEQELSLTRRYLEIEALRLGQRLQIEWNLPTPLPTASVPTLAVQTLAENAIRHGVEPSQEGGLVSLQVTETQGQLQLRVANDLPINPMAANTGHRIGLNAVRSRVHELTHGLGTVDTAIVDGRYIATISIPILPQAHPATR